MPLGPGTWLDGYEILRPLGSGGMGEVWLANEVRLERKVALKVLPAESTRDLGRVQRFEQEARAASVLNHPNVCHIYALGAAADGQHYIAMEYVEGETLRQRLTRGRPPLGEALDIAIQIATALSAAHAAGVVHRDLKPENVMIRPDGVAKVVDFGLAKDLERGPSTALTQANDITGTPMYLAPEAISDPETVDGRSDLYALGAVGYYLLAGGHVFEGATLMEVCSHHLRTPPVAPSTRLGRPLPLDLESVILACLEKDPARRPPTADALSTHLAMCVGVDEWGEARAREWWEQHGERLRGLRAGSGRATLVSGQTLSMELSARAVGRK
jgi:serine/threonine protein kinase